jgi:hypothetical protein
LGRRRPASDSDWQQGQAHTYACNHIGSPIVPHETLVALCQIEIVGEQSPGQFPGAFLLVRIDSFLLVRIESLNVRVWPKADILIAWANVCFRGQSGHRNLRASCPLLTQSGHQPRGCLLMAQSGHPDRVGECPLSGAKRTSKFKSVTSAFDPKRTLRDSLLPCKKEPTLASDCDHLSATGPGSQSSPCSGVTLTLWISPSRSVGSK